MSGFGDPSITALTDQISAGIREARCALEESYRHMAAIRPRRRSRVHQAARVLVLYAAAGAVALACYWQFGWPGMAPAAVVCWWAGRHVEGCR